MLLRLSSIALLIAFAAFTPNTVVAQQYTNLLSSDLNHWTTPNGEAVTSGWQLEPGGILHLSGKGGNIISKELYGDFELWFEFRISTKGNSGIKYRVQNYDKSLLGLEYQVLDDAAYPKLSRSHLTASLYDLVELIPRETRLNELEEFNVGKIRVQGNRTQHWINGQLTIDQTLAGSDWKSIVANSKFKDRENFGENHSGHLMLTDHNSEVWFKNMFVRRLDTVQCRPN
ncbi:MAG: DUF1080 domain-containing protein [Fuerstiella sp.]